MSPPLSLKPLQPLVSLLPSLIWSTESQRRGQLQLEELHLFPTHDGNHTTSLLRNGVTYAGAAWVAVDHADVLKGPAEPGFT